MHMWWFQYPAFSIHKTEFGYNYCPPPPPSPPPSLSLSLSPSLSLPPSLCMCRYEQYVEEAYVEYLRERNRPDEVRCNVYVCMCVLVTFSLPSPLLPPPPSQMQGVDPDGALKMYAGKGQWDKCLELAGKQVHSHLTTQHMYLYQQHNPLTISSWQETRIHTYQPTMHGI